VSLGFRRPHRLVDRQRRLHSRPHLTGSVCQSRATEICPNWILFLRKWNIHGDTGTDASQPQAPQPSRSVDSVRNMDDPTFAIVNRGVPGFGIRSLQQRPDQRNAKVIKLAVTHPRSDSTAVQVGECRFRSRSIKTLAVSPTQNDPSPSDPAKISMTGPSFWSNDHNATPPSGSVTHAINVIATGTVQPKRRREKSASSDAPASQ